MLQSSQGVIQHGTGFYCLDCDTYFHFEPAETVWAHPDLSKEIFPKPCGNSNKKYKVPVLEEIQ